MNLKYFICEWPLRYFFNLQIFSKKLLSALLSFSFLNVATFTVDLYKIMQLFNIINILNKYKIFQDCRDHCRCPAPFILLCLGKRGIFTRSPYCGYSKPSHSFVNSMNTCLLLSEE